MKYTLCASFAAFLFCGGLAAETVETFPYTIYDLVEVYTREEVKEMAKELTFDGVSNPGVNTSTLDGKVIVGYQGWFNTPEDGSHLYWKHYRSEKKADYDLFRPGASSIDYWPDMSELDEDEKFRTGFRKPDGSPAYVFSSRNPKTVARHFKWMKDYGIHAAAIQRFNHELWESPTITANRNVVLSNCRAAANEHGRGYIIMYDLSSMLHEGADFLMNDWKMLVDDMGITKNPKDKAYMYHNGKPLVGIWGVGFRAGKNKRQYTLQDCMRVIDFLKNDPQYGGCSILLGVPSRWREGGYDSNPDPYAQELYKKADIISPWTVGRYRSPDAAKSHVEDLWAKDLAWCKAHQIDYLPVAHPGVSTGNLADRGGFERTPRLGGKFLWQQYHSGSELGVTMVYQAMFDEMDEGTQIFKVDNNPPAGMSRFTTYGDLPSDHYLWLVGQAAARLEKNLPIEAEMPKRDLSAEKTE